MCGGLAGESIRREAASVPPRLPAVGYDPKRSAGVSVAVIPLRELASLHGSCVPGTGYLGRAAEEASPDRSLVDLVSGLQLPGVGAARAAVRDCRRSDSGAGDHGM